MLLGKRKEPIECILMLKDELREWKQQGKGEVHLGNIESNSFVLFTSEDGSEMCWKVEEEKRFSWNRNRRVTFYCDAEQVHRAFEFADLGLAEEFWASLQTTLRLETENENTPKSNMSLMYQAYSLTSVEAMSSTLINQFNLDGIISMSRDLPNALEELVRTPAQIKSLRSTYEQIKNRIGSDRDGSSDPEARVTMEKLIEVVKIIRSRW